MPSRCRSRLFRSIVLTSMGLLLSACGLLTDPGRYDGIAHDLSVNMRRWHDQGYSSYDYVLSYQCFCVNGGVPVRVSVRGNQVESVVYVSDGQPLPSNIASGYVDVDGLFRMLQDAIAGRAASIKAKYDPTLGYPTDVFIDSIENAADDEHGFLVTSLTPVAR